MHRYSDVLHRHDLPTVGACIVGCIHPVCIRICRLTMRLFGPHATIERPDNARNQRHLRYARARHSTQGRVAVSVAP